MSKVNWSKVGRRSKRKGKTYERRCAKLLGEWTGVNFRSTPASGGFNKQGVVIREEMFCGDLICDDPNFRFCVEAKNRDTFSFTGILKNPNTAAFSEWWWQCLDDATRIQKLPILFFKPDNAADFIALTALGLIATGYKGPHYKLSVYDDPVTITIEKKKLTVRLPTPYIINWKDFVKNVDSKLLFIAQS